MSIPPALGSSSEKKPGTLDPVDYRPVEEEEEEKQEEEAAREERRIQLPLTLKGSAQNRFQLLQRFYDLHLGASSSARRIFAFEALDTDSPTKIGTRAAMDSLCIAQMATTFQDSKLMMEARLLYGDSLRYLSSHLERLGAAQPDQFGKDQMDDVVGTLQALTSCAWFTCVKADDLEWMRYTQAVLKILDTFGWESMNPPMRRAFYYNWKYRAFFEGLTKRTKVVFTEPPNLSMMETSNGLLIQHAFDVPGLLWRTDKFLEASTSKSISQYMVIRILTEIGVCRSQLKEWHLRWIKRFPSSPYYRTVATKTFKDFNTLCGQFINVFPLAYDFANPSHERDVRIYAMCVLSLDQAIMEINHAFPEHCTNDQLRLQLREAECDAATSAADLCMLIPWSAQPQNMAFASIHSFLPLHLASVYYEGQGEIQQLAWCRKVTNSLSAKYGLQVKY